MDRHGLQGGAGAVQESGGGMGQAEVVVDGAFLMELLEDTPAAAGEQEQQLEDDDDADDRLSRVMRSLEAEIGGWTAPPAPGGGGDGAMGLPASGGGLELDDVLSVSDFDGTSRGSCSAETAPPLTLQSFEYWARAELPPAMGHDMGGGWCVDGDGLTVAGYEFREPCYYTYSYNDSSHVEQAYSPLWEIEN
ncbi:hypothetical protein E2562_019851 [Oryza meyeriana var. granulata]|uniref:Uncharacterized protein n=1 Tax=Oryza meyeriana var. granulata TaxID=110450 RepID=A0A6G1CRZ2_9ORYZ|nr:hypothetical protein E2562_019851 [Oryza meyeriana var. granulata]